MSNQQRGRKVTAQKKQPSLTAFYWIAGLVIVAGVAILLATITGQDASTAQNTPDTTTNTDQGQDAEPAQTLPMPELLPPSGEFDGTPTGQTTDGFHYKGDPNAPVVVVEYSDYQCPACGYHAQTTMPQLKQSYIDTGQAVVVFHDYPLAMHPNAPLAAEAARCAGEQGAYWQMHDIIFEKQGEWSEQASINTFADYASEVGVDRDAFVACMESGTYTQPINAAAQSARAAGITATPSFVINGKLVDLNSLFAEIEAALGNGG